MTIDELNEFMSDHGFCNTRNNEDLPKIYVTDLVESALKDGYAKAIDDFAEALNKKISEFVLEHKDNLDFASGISVAWNMVDEIAEQMKGE